MSNGPRKFVEFLGIRVFDSFCIHMEENLCSGYFSGLTFDIMHAWEEINTCEEGSTKEMTTNGRKDNEFSQQDVSLFYSDITPLIMENDISVGEPAFAWFSLQMPFVADIVNRKFIFESLTMSTGFRLYFLVYDKFVKEIFRCAKSLPKFNPPNGVDCDKNEIVLLVEGTSTTGRVIHHVKGTSRSGKLTLTNYALYFETSGLFSYERTFKIDLSKGVDQHVNSVCTGPWGAPFFDRGISYYEHSAFPEGIVMEFPELTSSTRRDRWLVLIKEVMLLHQFTRRFHICSDIHMKEIHARMILGIIRFYAIKEFIKMSPTSPKSFLIFLLLDEIPKGDYISEELAKSLKLSNSVHPRCATSLLMKITLSIHDGVGFNTEVSVTGDGLALQGDADLFDNIMDKSIEEAEKIDTVKTTTNMLKEEGISDSVFVFIEQLKQIIFMVSCFHGFNLLSHTARISAMLIALVAIYIGWVGKIASAFLLFVVINMAKLRYKKVRDFISKVIVSTSSDNSIVENIVSSQKNLQTATRIIENANISILKIRSILLSKTIKHADHVMIVLTGAAVVLAIVPMNIIIVCTILLYFIVTMFELGKCIQRRCKKRAKEWWDSIPIFRIETR